MPAVKEGQWYIFVRFEKSEYAKIVAERTDGPTIQYSQLMNQVDAPKRSGNVLRTITQPECRSRDSLGVKREKRKQESKYRWLQAGSVVNPSVETQSRQTRLVNIFSQISLQKKIEQIAGGVALGALVFSSRITIS